MKKKVKYKIMKSDLVRLIETLESNYEKLQAENIKLKRKINRLLKTKKERFLKQHPCSSGYTVDTENSFIRNSMLTKQHCHIQFREQMCKDLNEHQTRQEIPFRKRSSQKSRRFLKKHFLETNVRV